LQRKFIM